MKKSELKALIRPIVKECVQESVSEILLESGLLTQVISEVVAGIQKPLLENRQAQPQVVYVQAPGTVQSPAIHNTMPMTQVATSATPSQIQTASDELKASMTKEEYRAMVLSEMEGLDDEPMVHDHLKESRDRLEKMVTGKGLLADSGETSIFEGITPISKERKAGDPLKGIDEHDPGVPLKFFGNGGRFKQIKE
jgi:hypothetical protein